MSPCFGAVKLPAGKLWVLDLREDDRLALPAAGAGDAAELVGFVEGVEVDAAADHGLPASPQWPSGAGPPSPSIQPAAFL